jgi:hypothetical protein
LESLAPEEKKGKEKIKVEKPVFSGLYVFERQRPAAADWLADGGGTELERREILGLRS